MRVLHLVDISHRQWNDMKAMLMQSNMWLTVLECTFCWNLPHGPWSSASWWHSSRLAAREFLQVAGEKDPILQYCEAAVRDDRGLMHEFDEPCPLRELIQLSDFDNRGGKVSLTRWCSWFDVAEMRLPRWHSELAVHLYVALQERGGKDVRSLLWSLEASAGAPDGGALTRDAAPSREAAKAAGAAEPPAASASKPGAQATQAGRKSRAGGPASGKAAATKAVAAKAAAAQAVAGQAVAGQAVAPKAAAPKAAAAAKATAAKGTKVAAQREASAAATVACDDPMEPADAFHGASATAAANAARESRRELEQPSEPTAKDSVKALRAKCPLLGCAVRAFWQESTLLC